MATQMRWHKLSERTAATVAKPGRHSDGGNLFLVVDESGARRWVFLYKLHHRQREVGLGPCHLVSLADAREKAAEYRQLLFGGIDPLERKRAAKEAVSTRRTFSQCVDAYIESKQSGWRSQKHLRQWQTTLGEPCAAIRNRFVDEIDTAAVLSVLAPIWAATPETGSRLRARVAAVLGFATARGWREGDNPAAWANHLSTILPRRQKLAKNHLVALPYRAVPDFLAELPETVASLALRFLVLTACRSAEVLGARWSEIDLAAKIWSIPAGRMKAGAGHAVPLSRPVVEILERAAEVQTSELVFPGRDTGKQLSAHTLRRACNRDVTIHGFRSSFRDWCAEAGVSREIAESALAHATGNAVELAYKRTSFLEQRREVMEKWARFCGGDA